MLYYPLIKFLQIILFNRALLLIEQEEYSAIINFLNNDIYPAAASQNSKMKWNFKRKASSYFVGESQKLYKVGNKQYAKNVLFRRSPEEGTH